MLTQVSEINDNNNDISMNPNHVQVIPPLLSVLIEQLQLIFSCTTFCKSTFRLFDIQTKNTVTSE